MITSLALATGVQNASVRRMAIADANTTVLTTRLGSITAAFVAVGARPRHAGRRLATIAFVFLGALVGAILVDQSASWLLSLGLVFVVIAGALRRSASRPAPAD